MRAPVPLFLVLDALARLGQVDQEVLRLTAWEGLMPRSPAFWASAPMLPLSACTARGGRLAQGLYGPPNGVKGFGRVRTLLGWKGSVSRRSPKEQVR